MRPAEQCECVIDDPDKIRRFRATDAWSAKHGKYTKADEAAALAAWQLETPEDLEPIRIDASHMKTLWPAGFYDDAGYMGEVVCVTPDAVRMLGTSFWRVDVTLIFREDENLAVPVYMAENLFEGDWRPSVGKYVTGTLWMQACAKGIGCTTTATRFTYPSLPSGSSFNWKRLRMRLQKFLQRHKPRTKLQ
jgi:hypothetical protein